jgi:WD40 repeat protein
MNDQRLDPALTEWLNEGPVRGPRHALERALAATRRVEQRPGWVFPRKWLPRPIADWQARVPAAALVGLLVVLTLLLLLALGAALGGLPRHIKSPFGLAGDRLVAYQDGSAVVVSRIDGTDERVISGNVPYARSPQFSPNGRHVAFVAPAGPDRLGGVLFVASVEGAGQPRELSHGIQLGEANISSLAWSPDSTHIGFSAPVDGVPRIFVAGVDGNTLSPVTDAAAARDLPTWSADGTRIAFREKDPDGIRSRLRTMAVDGSDIQEVDLVIASDAYLSKLRWRPADFPVSYTISPGFGAPTSGQVSFQFGHIYQIWSQGVGGFVDNGVPWAPDGNKLAVLTAADGVIVADYDASTPYNGVVRKLGPIADCWIDWVPDGSGLYGGSPGDCSRTVLIPLSQPTSPWYLPGTSSGMASWQPLAP